jgi:hypothetical protein
MSFRLRILKGGSFQASSRSKIDFCNNDLNGEVIVVGAIMARQGDIDKKIKRKKCPRCSGSGKITMV